MIISLDFELHWGVRDRRSVDGYRGNLLGARAAIPALLETFSRFEVHATWATVGLLFFRSRAELVAGLPAHRPHYVNGRFSTYEDIGAVGAGEADDPLHYAPSLIGRIATYPNQEIGSHTFSHYYCLEEGQTAETFEHDLRAAVMAAEAHGITLRSMVFPRNQVNREYLSICRTMGITAFRGNAPSWIYTPRRKGRESLGRRALRLVDAYISVTGHNAYLLAAAGAEVPLNVAASRFLRPYSARLRRLEGLRLRRILGDLDFAARNGLAYHLWWHPHNFGRDLRENMLFLEAILRHVERLREMYDFESLNMGEAAERVIGNARRGERAG